MNITFKSSPLFHSKQSDAYVINNPTETRNAHSITQRAEASKILNLSTDNALKKLRDDLQDYDMTSISTYELAEIGIKLYETGVIDGLTAGLMISGNNAYDKNGYSTLRHVKFNAIAMFNQKMGDNRNIARLEPGLKAQADFKAITQALLAVNRAVNALHYFSPAYQDTLPISQRV